MTMRITVEISTTDDQAYTPRELAIIQAMQVHPSNGAAAAATAKARVTEPVATEDEAKPVAKRTRATTKAKVEEPAVEEAPAEDEDLLGNGGDTEYTLDDLVTASTELINAGKQGIVKGALADFGAKRVTELDAKEYASYMAKIAE